MAMRSPAGFISAFYDPLKNPNPPTGVTVSTSSTTAIVAAFTAPTDVGGSAITSYIAKATRVSDGVTFSASGTSSPITITGLTAVPFTVTVVAVNSYGPSASSAPSGSITPALPAIGSALGGGYFAGQISSTANGVATHNLIVSDKSVGQADRSYYVSYPPPTDNPTDKVTGAENTANLVANYGSGMPAAYFCENLNTGGYTDWYLPAANELEILYWFLKPTNDLNTNGIWANVNAVSPEPYNTNHTSSPNVPSQTTAAAFQDGGAQAFNTTTYISSTQSTLGNPQQCFVMNFYTAASVVDGKTPTFKCRAIRKVPV